MRSAGLKYGTDGKVAWDEIWGSFCDLAMAGGPPHKGRLLEPASRTDVDARPDRYREVAMEICRGIRMATGLEADLSPVTGWVRVACLSPGMAGWLVRAIVMENIAARADRTTLDLPAAPHFRLEKEIKNVVTVIAKTCHYWKGHMPRAQQRAIARMFAELAEDSPLIEPALRRRKRRRRRSPGRFRRHRRNRGARHRAAPLDSSLRGLVRRGVPGRAKRHLDDARDGRQQHPVAPRRNRALRACQSIERSRRRSRREDPDADPRPRGRKRHRLSARAAWVTDSPCRVRPPAPRTISRAGRLSCPPGRPRSWAT